jgi:transcriptional regulator with XRE-family HTH domain
MPKLRIGPKRPLRAFLAEWRESKGLNQEQVGGRFDPPVEKGQVSKWETAGRQGAINTAVVAEYAEALGIKDARRMYSMPPKDKEPPTLDDLAMEQGIDKGVVAAFIELSAQRRRAG